MKELFEQDLPPAGDRAPLAERLRPKNLQEFIGQEHLVGQGKILRRVLEEDKLPSMIFWGPPGTGKTTLARIVAGMTEANFIPFSAVTSGIKEVRNIMARAEQARGKTILFIDEIHRFNRAQQDAFLPFVEKGAITLIGATTENPSFEVNGALLSRCKVLILNPLTVAELEEVLGLAAKKLSLQCEEGIFAVIAGHSDGDARRALNTLEAAANLSGGKSITKKILSEALQKKSLLYDKSGEEHYNIISALHKSLCNSDPDAAVYWLARMIEGGEDPLYIARRMIRFASEDIGLADPHALRLALDAKEAFHFIGPPEGHLALVQAAVYLALAPKSNAIYKGYGRAVREVNENPAAPVPLHIRNAVTKLMKKTGYGRGYEYAHDAEEGTTGMTCLPDQLAGRRYYVPGNRGMEKELARRLAEFERIRQSLRQKGQGKYSPPAAE